MCGKYIGYVAMGATIGLYKGITCVKLQGLIGDIFNEAQLETAKCVIIPTRGSCFTICH